MTESRRRGVLVWIAGVGAGLSLQFLPGVLSAVVAPLDALSPGLIDVFPVLLGALPAAVVAFAWVLLHPSASVRRPLWVGLLVAAAMQVLLFGYVLGPILNPDLGDLGRNAVQVFPSILGAAIGEVVLRRQVAVATKPG